MPETATRKKAIDSDVLAQAAFELFLRKAAGPLGNGQQTTEHLARESFREARVFLKVAQTQKK